MRPLPFLLAFVCLCLQVCRGDTKDSIQSEGVIAAPVAAVWAAWTTTEGLKSWLAPQADIDLKVDGLMRANYQAGSSLEDKTTIVNRVLSYEPGRMLSIRVARAPEGFPFPNAIKSMWTVMYFDKVSETETRMRVVSLGFGPDDESQKMRAFFEKGNAFTLQQLQKRFSK